jgi:hypothetical protein
MPPLDTTIDRPWLRSWAREATCEPATTSSKSEIVAATTPNFFQLGIVPDFPVDEVCTCQLIASAVPMPRPMRQKGNDKLATRRTLSCPHRSRKRDN